MAKLTVEVSDTLDEVLEELADSDAQTKSQVVRRSIALYKVLEDERKRGRKLIIADKDDKPLKEIVAA